MRKIIVIVFSIAVSAATTILLMIHYTKPLETDVVKRDRVSFQQVYSEREVVKPVELITVNPIQLQKDDLGNTESIRPQLKGHRYFDYALLSKDLAVFSEKVSGFNEVLSREIQKLRKVALAEE